MRTAVPKFVKTIDPVCGRVIDTRSPYHCQYKGISYYFCSQRDLDEFNRDPDKYAIRPEELEEE